jgi:DNA-binding transcriptional MocR family regulator
MGRGPHAQGERTRGRLLADLARRWRDLEPTPSMETVAVALGVSRATVLHHVAVLRERGDIRPDALWPTAQGLRKTGQPFPLTD